MSITDAIRGGGTDSKLYFAVGGLSLLKALAVRGDKARFRSELADAALFLGIGVVLQRAEQRRSAKLGDVDRLRQEVRRQFGGQEESSGFRDRARKRLGREQEPESRSLADRILG
ncbi:hypothetical protein [Halostella litorea]|uniref:hypothetical protein n=1 Tax=Halostella litorea TaxID=2528831 RepID=UPI001092ED8B|nr:hypothetical protein [Halostella litorea]